MREILFRAKSHYMNQWLYGFVVHDDEWFISVGPLDAKNHIHCLRVKEDTIGQSTGFYDKNYSEIFEGDILRIEDEDGNYYITKVWYERGGLVIDVKGCDYDCTVIGWVNYCSMEVIGNIHDNPELLEVK